MVRPALALALLLAACGGPQLSRLPSQGGPRWREIASPHFVLRTDLDLEDARDAVRSLEQYRELLVEVVFGEAPRARRARNLVVAVRGFDDWRALGARRDLLGFTWADSILRQPVLAFVGQDDRGFARQDRGETIVHELAHLVSFAILGPHPRWLAEGIASYFESARVDRVTRHGSFGRFPWHFQDLMRANGLQPFDRVVSGQVDPAAQRTPAFYMSSHIVVSFLMNTRPEVFMTYQERLTETTQAQHDVLWGEVFPDLPPSRLPGEISAWMKGGAVREHRLELTLAAPELSERELSDADVEATRALVIAAVAGEQPDAPARIERHAAAALAIDATHPMAALLSAMVAGKADAGIGRTVTRAHPDDYLAWLLLGAPTTGAEQREAVGRLCALAGQNPAIDLSKLVRCPE